MIIIGLKNVKAYAVTRLVHHYTLSHYVEPVSKYTDKEFSGLIYDNIMNYYENKMIGIPKFGK